MALIVDAGSNPFELGVATELFGLRRPELDRPWYDVTLCSATPTARPHLGFATLSDLAGLDAADRADTVIVPNRPDPEAGVLDGRRTTTHWRWADAFAARCPGVALEPDVLFVDDGSVLTAAASAAALDLGLHVIRRDHGAEVANAVSRRLVFAAHRDGGQRQFVERPVPPTTDTSPVPVLDWATARLDRPSVVQRRVHELPKLRPDRVGARRQ